MLELVGLLQDAEVSQGRVDRVGADDDDGDGNEGGHDGFLSYWVHYTPCKKCEKNLNPVLEFRSLKSDVEVLESLDELLLAFGGVLLERVDGLLELVLELGELPEQDEVGRERGGTGREGDDRSGEVHGGSFRSGLH